MDARTAEAEDDVARANLGTGQHLVAIDGAYAEAGEVIVSSCVHAGHLGRFAADQCATRLPASLGDRGNDLRRNLAVELPGREIVEEEERLRALHDQIVGAHGDEVDSDAVMLVRLDRQLELGPDAVVRGNEQRIVISGGLGIEESSEPAELDIGPRARG